MMSDCRCPYTYFNLMSSFLNLKSFLSLAGFPATIVYAATSLVTTEHAAMTAFLPILIPGKMVAFTPMQTPSSIIYLYYTFTVYVFPFISISMVWLVIIG